MADGARELFNQRLLPPLTREDADWAVAPYDQDRVGLKGHFNFDIVPMKTMRFIKSGH